MKTVCTFFAFLILCMTSFTLSHANNLPKSMSYQAIIRNGSQGLIVNGTVSVRISILKESEFGSPAYVERHIGRTNANGLLTLNIGMGSPLFGTFQSIDWTVGPYFLRTETDPMGGTEYGITSVSQILTVPYAIQSHKALMADSVKTEKDPLFTRSVASAITAQDTVRWNAAISTEADPMFMAWDKDYADLTNKPTTDGSETKVSGSGVIAVNGNGTTATPYTIAMKPIVLNATIDNTNIIAVTGSPSLIVIQSNNDGSIDKITLPATGENGQVLYVIHKRTSQGDAPEINLESLNGHRFTYIYADGAWQLFSEL